MNKLGFYVEVSDDKCGLWDAIDRVKPPVLLFHSNSLNRLLLRQVRQFRSPNAFVIGRIFLDLHEQERQLTEGDPAENGRRLADQIINLDFGVAHEEGANGRRLIDAWMSLNEVVPGPASSIFAEDPVRVEDKLRRYDSYQAAFAKRLHEAGLEAVAFNFAAGNFSQPEHYLKYFRATLAEHTCLGFHEYGWPTLFPADGTSTGAGLYRPCMAGIRAEFGDRHRVIITELGMTREYRHPSGEPRHPLDVDLGDLGWLNHTETVSEESYWSSLDWYNSQILQDEYVLGSCLYEVGHSGRFAAHRHLCEDNEGHPIHIIDRVVALNAPAAPAVALTAAPVQRKIAIRGLVTLDGAPIAGAAVRLVGSRKLARLRRASALDPEASAYAITAVCDARGAFRIRDLPAGEYTLEVNAPGASPFSTGFSAAASIIVPVLLTRAPDTLAEAAPALVRRLECGINVDPANPTANPSGAALRELGATWVRLVFQNHPNQPLSDSFTQYDRVVADMRQAGVNVLMILNNQSCPGKPPREALDDAAKWREYIVTFAQRCREIAEHYRNDVPAFQIWNEPDHDGVLPGYDPTVRAGLYGEMLRAAFTAMRPVTEALIVTAGMASGNPGYVKNAIAATGNKLFADVLAVHPYGRRPKFHWPNATWGGLGDTEMVQFLKSYRAVVDKPIWVTEYGTEDRHTFVADPSGAALLANDLFPETTFESVGASLFKVVTKFFWFCWSDGMRADMGLVEMNGARKGAFTSFRAYAERPLAV